MTPVKVTTTKDYKTHDNRDIKVTLGKFISIPIEFGDFDKSHFQIKEQIYKPIVISETEEIKAYDKRYAEGVGIMDTSVEEEYAMRQGKGIWNKVLVTDEQFSKSMIHVILSGRLKDGDPVFIECEEVYEGGELSEDKSFRHNSNLVNRVKLADEEKFVALYPIVDQPLFPSKKSKEQRLAEVLLKYIPHNLIDPFLDDLNKKQFKFVPVEANFPEPKTFDFTEQQISDYQKLLEEYSLPEIALNKIFFHGADWYREALTIHFLKQMSLSADTSAALGTSESIVYPLSFNYDRTLTIVENAMRYAYNLGLSKDGVGGAAGVKEWFDKQISKK